MTLIFGQLSQIWRKIYQNLTFVFIASRVVIDLLCDVSIDQSERALF